MTELIENIIKLKTAVSDAHKKTANSTYHPHLRYQWEKEYEILQADLVYYTKFVHNKLEKLYVVNNKEYVTLREKYKDEWDDIFNIAYSDSEEEIPQSDDYPHQDQELIFHLDGVSTPTATRASPWTQQELG